MAGVEVVKAGKDEFQTDWATAADVNIPQPEVADVSLSCLSLTYTVVIPVH